MISNVRPPRETISYCAINSLLVPVTWPLTASRPLPLRRLPQRHGTSRKFVSSASQDSRCRDLQRLSRRRPRCRSASQSRSPPPYYKRLSNLMGSSSLWSSCTFPRPTSPSAVPSLTFHAPASPWLTIRGIQKPGLITTTSCMLSCFRTQHKMHEEFLTLMKHQLHYFFYCLSLRLFPCDSTHIYLYPISRL
jgi:hypothetical protein